MVIASIDIMQGKVVQLQQGRDKVLERDDPAALAAEFDKYGEIAVIDLDAAMGKGENTALIKDVVQRGECRVGGGIRSVDKAKELVTLGAKKVIIGSQAFEHNQINTPFLEELAAAIGRPRVIVAVDSLHGHIVTRGWKHQTNIPLLDAVQALEPYTSEFLFTCVEREGTMTGTDRDLVQQLVDATKREVTVAGGVATMDELLQLTALGVDVQLGMALYTGKIDLAEAFVECLNWRKMDLLPAIAQDEHGQVLMLAYCNKAALRKAFELNYMTYYSRSRQELWTKGLTSGHVQHLIRLRADCDQDTILATVKQVGAACHLDTYSCFGDRRFALQDLQESEAEHPAGISGEQLAPAAQTLAAETEKSAVVSAAADVFEVAAVRLAERDVMLDEVFAELARRQRRRAQQRM